MQTEYTILSIANRIHYIKHCTEYRYTSTILSIAHRINYIKHCKENTLYYALQREYTILTLQTEYTTLSIVNSIHYIKHCKQNTLY